MRGALFSEFNLGMLEMFNRPGTDGKMAAELVN